jgi:multidrug efflux pump subunit AcrB
MSIIGFILLGGVVVNNGIVLLAAIRDLRDTGMNRAAAILEGAKIRFRPIVMTAVTTIVGLLPMALSTPTGTGEGVNYRNMACAVAGGLLVSTMFTVFCVPLAYTWFDDAAIWLRRAWFRMLGPMWQPPAAANQTNA